MISFWYAAVISVVQRIKNSSELIKTANIELLEYGRGYIPPPFTGTWEPQIIRSGLKITSIHLYLIFSRYIHGRRNDMDSWRIPTTILVSIITFAISKS